MHFPNNTVMIKTNATGKTSKYLCMGKLQEAVLRDPDLASIPTSNRAQVLQAVYVLSGCDFVSFFAEFGKAAFFKCLLMYSDFIAGQQLLPGDLSENTASEPGLQAFIRLTGCLYFIEHRRAFGNSTTPASLYYQLQSPANDSTIQHAEWLDAIRNEVWPRIYFENKLIPSLEALQRHYHRAMWVINYWRQAANNSMDLLPPQYNGWKMTETGLQVDWDSDENIQQIKQHVDFLLHGCKCKSSKCTAKQCKCVKNGQLCGPGCECKGCLNNQHTGERQI